MRNTLESKFGHWRKDPQKKPSAAPHTVRQAKGKKLGRQVVSGDCSADPCSCTGCSDWD